MIKHRSKKSSPLRGSHIPVSHQAAIPTDDERPIFSLLYIDKAYCLSLCTQEEKAAFADTLLHLSRIQWKTLKTTGRHGCGCEKIDRQSIKGSIPTHITDDTYFLAFRFYHMAPMVGYRQGNIFHIVWIDRGYSLYQHT